jgi:UDP-N-acetyl-D-mannosaminuronic acid transferase (WecB/TagA/CpsF family)
MATVLEIDNYDLNEAVRLVSAFGSDRYGYVVTPNVDHIIRHYRDFEVRALYAHPSYVLLDSRFLAHTVGLFRRQILRVCLGSDLTTDILRTVIKPHDVDVSVGGSSAQAQRERFGLEALRHIDPPMSFILNAAAGSSVACVKWN